MNPLPPNPEKIGVSKHLCSHLRPILTWPNPILSKKCEDVTEFDDDVGQILMDMFFTMDSNDGIGLAAPQLGILKNIITISLAKQYLMEPKPNSTIPPEYDIPFQERVVLINPKIVGYGKDENMMSYEEGCLSVPGFFEMRKRPASVIVEYDDARGKNRQTLFEGLAAFAIQHEIDHLGGKLFIDGLSNLKKDRIKKKILKTIKKRSVAI